MSYSLDANVLLFASDRASERHAAARMFLESCAASPEVLCVTWPTLMAYLRIATHPSTFGAPLAPDEALSNVKALLAPAADARPVGAGRLHGRLPARDG